MTNIREMLKQLQQQQAFIEALATDLDAVKKQLDEMKAERQPHEKRPYKRRDRQPD
jgi:chaperonin cofactor prefoldin